MRNFFFNYFYYANLHVSPFIIVDLCPHFKRKIMKKTTLFLLLVLSSFSLKAQRNYDVAAYLYPAYVSDDVRLRPFWPMGIGEWETVMTMQQRKIDQAADHGVNVFIFDWYWFDGRPFMETTLTNGFLKARNRDRMQFYLMWANHDVKNYWDTRIAALKEPNVIWRGAVSREEFERICLRNIEMFFKQPNYYKIDGKPVFMIYEVSTFIDGLGGVEQAADALKWFRKQVKKASSQCGKSNSTTAVSTMRRKRILATSLSGISDSTACPTISFAIS